MKKENKNTNENPSVDRPFHQLQERAKELNCLYRVDGVLNRSDYSMDDIYTEVIKIIPLGWQYPDVCVARISVDNKTYKSPSFIETEWGQKANIVSGGVIVGDISVFYTQEMPQWDDGPFLIEESQLIKTIAYRLATRISNQNMKDIIQQWEGHRHDPHQPGSCEWKVVVQMLKQTDRDLYVSISRKMLNYMCWRGIKQAEELLQTRTPDPQQLEEAMRDDWNQAYERRQVGFTSELCGVIIAIASENLSDEVMFTLIQGWIQEDKLSFLAQVVNRNLSLAEVADAIRRYYYLAEQEQEIHSPNKRGIEVSLIRRFLSDQLQYIDVAKGYIQVHDFHHLLNNVVFVPASQGKLGGKSAGLYLASQILKVKAEENELLRDVRTPKTYHITSDLLLHFMHYNNIDEVVEQKYKPINQVRFEYPHIVQTFKSGQFPTEVLNGLSSALDDLGTKPLVVRSSSLLEDRVGASFSGKYKSVFVANQGRKTQRLQALLDAVAEVYASTFGPDPIEYRTERGLIDFGEEMGVMIQEVVGTRVGKYFLPSFAGVAFSKNEFRWSPRIKREDGLIRLVLGLGTRAVDRLSNDYPVLIAPGQPGLQVNATPEEVVAYSPSKVDVINLETNAFETIDAHDFIAENAEKLPRVENIVSIFEDGLLRTPTGINVDYDRKNTVVTFNGLAQKTPFIKQIKAILDTLEEAFGLPIDIEFASDGRNFYLLQCRSQSYSENSAPAPIPRKIPKEKIIFSANKHISNGKTPDITHIVYVDAQKYAELHDRSAMIKVGRIVGHLNKLLPKRQFILMGPGRWGSRGDIKMGVSVTYSDINNSAALIEIAHKKGNYVPDLSFGTHFFQDLVEADIRYLPLYPDEKDVIFNADYLFNSKNILADILPEFSQFADVIHVVDVPSNSNGNILRILLNADLEKGIGLLVSPTEESSQIAASDEVVALDEVAQPMADEQSWRWRLLIAEKIATSLDADKYGVVNIYVFGSTKNATAGPGSDINILIHFRGNEDQKEKLNNWLDGWNCSLSEMNYLKTGHRLEKILDVHFVTDEDIAEKTSWAMKINATTDAARLLPMKIKSE